MPEKKRRSVRPFADIVVDLEQLTEEPGFIYTFALMVARCLWMSTSEVADVDWTERPNQEELSFLLGLLVKHPIRLDQISSETAIIERAQRADNLLRDLHISLVSPKEASGTPTTDAKDRVADIFRQYADWMNSGGGMVEPIFYGGEGAYHFQYLDMASKVYAGDDQWIQDYHGASIEAFVGIAEELGQLSLARLQDFKPRKTTVAECRAVLSAMTFRSDDLPSVSRQSWNEFIGAFSLNPGEINGDLNTPGDYNAVHSLPLVALGDGRYWIPIFANLPKAIYESPYYWMIDDDRYRDTALSNRGAAIESVTQDLLVPIFGCERVFKGVNVRQGKADITDIDVLAISGNKAVIVQCKSKKLTINSKRGDGTALRNDFTKAVQDAYDQAIKAGDALVNEGHTLTDENRKSVLLPGNVDEFYILCVTGGHYPAVITQARSYLKRQDDGPHPVLLSVFDLDLICHYLKDRYEFLYYLRQRTRHGDHFVADSEMSLLGFHLKHKLFPDEKYDRTGIDTGFSQLVEADFLAARGDWPKPDASDRLFHTWNNEIFDELVEDIKSVALTGPGDFSVEDLLFFMYDLAGKGADDLIRSVERFKEQTLLDGREHSARVPITRHKKGVTFVSFPRPRHPNQLRQSKRRLEAIGVAHKYRSRADEWMVLASFAGSPVRFDIFGYIQSPWEQDPEMDQWIEEILGPGILVNTDGKRPSRNQVCPCGSGKKFKRCHGR